MNRPSNKASTQVFASLVLGASVALTACAPESGEDTEEPVAEGSQGLTTTWEWKDVPGTQCGNGSQTGFGISVGTSSDVVIYLEGGGACWDDTTCGAGIASYVASGYNGATFGSGPSSGIFDRTKANNPYKASTIVYIPYCTGDYHSGDTVGGSNGNLHFNGRVNLELDLAKVKAAFPNPSRVTLTGSSAGGFGSLFNYGRVAQLFSQTRVDLVTDSAPVLWNNAIGFTGIGTWNTKASLPAGCTDCASSMRNLYGYYSKAYPNSRFAFLGFDQDPTMSVVVYGLLPQLYTEELRKLVFNTFAPAPNWKHFVAAGSKHTMLYAIDTASQNKRCSWVFGMCFAQSYGGTMSLGDWLTKMYTDDPSWTKQSALIE